MGQKRPFPFKNGLFLVYSTIAEIRAKFDHFGPQKGRWARNGLFPFENGLFFAGLQHNSRNSGRMPFPFKNGFLLVYSTIAEIRAKFDHFGPQKRRWARNGPFPSKNGFLGLQHDSINSGQISPFRAPKGQNSHHKLPRPDKIVVRDWKHPARAPSKKTKGLQPLPNPNWHLITSFQAQTRSLFKIGSIPSGHHLKKRKASSHPQTQTGIRLVWTSPACRPKSNCSRLEATSQGTV